MQTENLQFSKRLSDSVLVMLDAITYYPLINQSINQQVIRAFKYPILLLSGQF